MDRILLVMALIALVGPCLAFEIPSKEECAKEIETALKNIELGRKNLAGSDYISAGTCYNTREEYEKAADCLLKAAELRKAIEAYSSVGVCYDGVGDMYKKLGNGEKAKEYYNLAVEYFLKGNSKDIYLADVYLKMGDYENACKYCKMDSVYTYEDCVKQKYCNAASFGSSSSGGLDYGSNGGLPLIPVAVVIVFLVAIAGFFLTKKKRK